MRSLLLRAPAAIGVPATAAGDQAPQTPSAPSWIAARMCHSCAVMTGGSVRCWGYGGNGQLGYTITALDNVTGKPGPRSAMIKAGTHSIPAHKAVR